MKRRREPYMKLLLYLKENNIRQKEVAELLGKTTSAFNQQLNGTGGDFTVDEVVKICGRFGISAEKYFFADRVSITKLNLEQ